MSRKTPPRRPDVRAYGALAPYLRAMVQYLGITWTDLASRAGKSEGWVRKVRKGTILLDHHNADELATVLDVPPEDVDYWRALVRVQSDTWQARARALGYMFRIGNPMLEPVEGPEHDQWMQDQDLLTWTVLHLVSDADDDVDEVAGRLRPPVPPRAVQAAIERLSERGLLGDAPSPHLQPATPQLHRAIVRRARQALASGWPPSKRMTTGVTFALDEAGVAIVERQLRDLAAELKGLAETGEDHPVLYAQLTLLPATVPFEVTTPVEVAPRDTSFNADSALKDPWINPAGVAWQQVVRDRLRAAGKRLEDLAAHLGVHTTWVSRVLGQGLSIHESRDPAGSVTKMMDMIGLTHETLRTEFQALVDVTHPNPQVRRDGMAVLSSRKPFALLEEVKSAVVPGVSWHDVVALELSKLGALPPEPLELANRLYPPIPVDVAAAVRARLTVHKDSPYYQVVHPSEGNASQGTARRHGHWCDFLDRCWEHEEWHPSCSHSLVLPVPHEAFVEARRIVESVLTVVSREPPPTPGGTARVHHLRCSLLEGAS